MFLVGHPGYEAFLNEIERRVFGDVKDWESFEIKFMQGCGLKEKTYTNWKSGLRSFFEDFLEMNTSPFRVTIGMIEKFYDYIRSTRSPQTASVRISQLRAFYKRF